MASPTLAIDFGTSRTKVGYYDEAAGKAQLVEIGREIRTVLPSVFYIPKEGQGERLVGDDAQDMVDSDPEGIVLSLKKELHKLGKKRCGPERPAADRIQLASDLFSHIRQRCQTEVFHNETINRCRLTVPVDFKAQQREAIRDAAKLGGFEEITLIEEPVAAAQHWLLNQSNEKFGDSVVVCDVGGGTTDFAFLRYADGRFQADEQVLSSGFPLGGNDLDQSIWERICECNPAMQQCEDQLAGFLIKIRRERELMTKTRKPEIRLAVGGRQCLFSQGIMEAATAEFAERVKAETLRFLEKIENQTKITDAPILLVGGASRLPGLHDAVKALNRGNVFLWNECDYATVLGAVDIPTVVALKHLPQQNKSSEVTPQDTSNWDSKGNSLQSIGRHEEAIRCYEKALEINPRDTASWYEKGRSLAALGRHKGAIRCYDRVLGINSRDTANWFEKGCSHAALGHPREAVGCFDKVLEISPRDYLAWHNKGCNLADLRKHEEAIHCFEKALDINPRGDDDWACIGRSLHALDRHEEAIRCFNKALEIDSRNAETWYFNGNSLAALVQHEEAIRCYDTALEIDPGYVAAWGYKGNSLTALERHKEAIICYDKVLENGPHDYFAWRHKGDCLSALGRHEEAKAWLAKGREIWGEAISLPIIDPQLNKSF